MAQESYGRGQVEWALWRSFVDRPCDSGDAPRVFRTRIKRLLEIDRALDLSKAEVPPEAKYAFAPPVSAESGEVAYIAVDVFCLALALDLIDAGFKQGEVVFLMRCLRTELQKRYSGLLKSASLAGHQRCRAKDYPDLPSYEDRGFKCADGRVFLVLQKIELSEILPQSFRERHSGPVILEPDFCRGATALGEKLREIMPYRRRAVTVLELAMTAQTVDSFLKAAPVIRRGRPKAQEARTG